MRTGILSMISSSIGQLCGRFSATGLVQGLSRAYRLGFWRYRLASFGEGSHIYPNVVIHCPEKVRIGAKVNIAEFVHMWGDGGIEIGDNTIVASHVVITSQAHEKYARIFRDSSKMAPVRIEANCWIGAGAIILPGVCIGEGSIVAAQAVVTKDVEPYTVVAGVPARLLERLTQ